MNISELRNRIKKFNSKPGVGFNPRVIILDFDAYRTLARELDDLSIHSGSTTHNTYSDHINFMGISVVHESQVLEIK